MLKKNILLFLLILFGNVTAQNLDFRILRSLNQKEMPVWDKGMKGLSATVNPLVPVTIVGIWANGYFTHDKVMMRNGIKSGLSIGFAALVSAGLKGAIDRVRPAKRYPGEIIQRTHSGWFSFCGPCRTGTT